MQRAAGSASADLLVGIGLDRRDVIRGLVREIGMDEDQAVSAWMSAIAKMDADFPYRLMVAIDAPAH